ncbi:diacylglyceryl transferase [Flavobacterium rakeshii]|uniref:Diacylglyceryl transferase n=2 Tax=Flavobacterium TaxID=237 RepID=A0A0A2M565_9FLAO|nr:MULTISPECIES: DUF6787 family protein [Flavobacterium]KGO83475.1 diacylglyceryl transferase [Flavobacterium beibuense F44-8]MEE1898751.1 DUF6787 family protein [Flavobacterium rakeshii]MUV04935.1 diacylglyceryl transferase [Flavobacterium rakeshii]
MEKLKKRWGITSNFQLIVIFIVFAITGSTSAYLSKPVIEWIGISKDAMSPWLYIPLRLLIIFPVYQVLLVFFGLVSGQFKFFWNFEKKMLRGMGLGFLFKNKKSS